MILKIWCKLVVFIGSNTFELRNRQAILRAIIINSDYCIQISMKSERSLRIEQSRNERNKDSNSPTLASSYSEKRLWAKTFKNQPFPKELKRRLIGHKFKFQDFSDGEEDNSGVVEEEDEIEVLEKKKLLPHFEIMNDRGEFAASRSRMRSQRKYRQTAPRCKSVESLKLPQVVEEKKEEEDQKVARSKLAQFKDKNQFNQRSNRNSQTNSDKENLQLNYLTNTVPEKIIENQAEQTKSDKLKNDKSIITTELQKIIVDEIDGRKKKEDQQQIQEIIEQERQEQETVNVNKLRISLGKLDHQNQYLNKFKEEQLRHSRNASQNSQRSNEHQQMKAPPHQQTINENHQ